MNTPLIEMIRAIPTMEGGEGLLAILFTGSGKDPRPTSNGPLFLTSPEAPLQAAFMRYNQNHTIEAHYHPHQQRTVDVTGEVIIVMKGRVLVNLYTSEGKHERELEMVTGDVLIQYSGGHSFVMLEDSEIIEIKQGPYDHHKDKVRFVLHGHPQ